MNETTNILFAPQLYIQSGVKDIDFYVKAFGATELYRWNNPDGSMHVAELGIGGAVFHLHEASVVSGCLSPAEKNGTTVVIGLFVPDVDVFMNRAIAAGAKEISAAQDYDYGYRQGTLEDPFGHTWMIQMKT